MGSFGSFEQRFGTVKHIKKTFLYDKKKASVLTPDAIAEIQRLHIEGLSIREISTQTGIDYSTVKKGERRGVLNFTLPSFSSISTASLRSQSDSVQAMGKACQNVVERASLGTLSCPSRFDDQVDLQYGGILVTLPALIACGILNGIERFDLSNVYYTAVQIFLSLALMVMLRVKQLEQSQLLSCGESGRTPGMDRTPCVQTLRNRLRDFTQAGNAREWSLDLSRYWMKEEIVDGVLYVDGHVNIYYGKSVDMPKRYVSRLRLCMSGSTDYWVNGAIGEPYFAVHKTINEGLIKTLTKEIIPELDKSVPHQPDRQQLAANPHLHRYMIVFDREGYSVPFFIELKKQRIAFCSYRKYVKDKWDISEFKEYTVKDTSGNTVRMKLAERGVYLLAKKEKGKPQEGIWVREIRKLTTSGHQTSIITSNFSLSIEHTGVYMFARWNQENYFKYATQSFGIDCLISNEKNSIPDTYTIPNPEYISLNQEHKSISGKLAKKKQKLAENVMEIDRGELGEKGMKRYLQQKAEILQIVEIYRIELEEIKLKKKEIPRQIHVRETEPGKGIQTVINDRRLLMETIKNIGYRAESALANQIKPLMNNPDEARNVIRSIYQSNADLIVDKQNNKLRVCLHHSNFAHVDNIIRKLCQTLNESQTVMPGTDLTLFYVLVSEKIP